MLETKQELKKSEAVYTCQNCGNTKKFFERGFAHVTQEVEFHKVDGRLIAEVGDTTCEDFEPAVIVCAYCGTQV